VEDDEVILWQELRELATASGVSVGLDAGNDAMDIGNEQFAAVVTQKHAAELVRYGGCQLHSLSAFIGGVAAQEIVKILTHQYIPLNCCFVYNGIASSAATYSL
jgi:hypothetical protein